MNGLFHFQAGLVKISSFFARVIATKNNRLSSCSCVSLTIFFNSLSDRSANCNQFQAIHSGSFNLSTTRFDSQFHQYTQGINT